MFYRTAALASATLFAATMASADGHSAIKGFALAGDGATLITMENIAYPGEVMSYDLDMPVDAIAYRPVTGELLGIADGAVYTINAMTGAMTDLDVSFADDAKVEGVATAFDFNNAIDAVRAVGSDGTNLVYFPSDFGDERANTVLRFTDTFYAEGDMHEGTEPLIYANAYTNAIAGMKAGSTAQYALDARTNALVMLANNAGELTTVGTVTIDGEPADLVTAGGFDIVSPMEGTDMAYAMLQLDDAETSGLYSVNLETAEATMIADLGTTGFTGFAVAQGGM